MRKIICENEIGNVTFKLSSNDDKKKYQQLHVEHVEMKEVIQVAPCDYFTAINAIMFSKTLKEVQGRFKGTWEEYAVNGYINFITNGDD